MGVGPVARLPRLDRGIVFAGQIETGRHLRQLQRQVRLAGVEPNAVFESDTPFLRTARPHQHRAEDPVGTGEVWTYWQSALDLGERSLVDAARHQDLAA